MPHLRIEPSPKSEVSNVPKAFTPPPLATIPPQNQKKNERNEKKVTNPACPLGLILQAPTPSSTPIKFPLANTASSPFVYPLISCPSTNACRRSRLRLCVLSGSLNDPDGGDRNGGGNGLGVRFANNPMPVSNRNGSFGNSTSSVCRITPETCFSPSSSGVEVGVAKVDDVADALEPVTSAAAISPSDLRYEKPVTKPVRHTCGGGDRSCAAPRKRPCDGVVEASWYSRRGAILLIPAARARVDVRWCWETAFEDAGRLLVYSLLQRQKKKTRFTYVPDWKKVVVFRDRLVNIIA